jgi:hypothetical protein
MKADFRSEAFTHCKCSKCGYLSTIDKFSMIEKPIDNTIQTKVNEALSLGEITLSTYEGTCPLCSCKFVDFLYGSEVN